VPGSLSGQSIIDPVLLKRSCDEQGIPTDSWWLKCNSFTCPLYRDGDREWGYGFVLMDPASFAALPESRDDLYLNFQDDLGGNITFGPLTVTSNDNILPSDEQDSASFYMVELADRRYLWRQTSVGKSYNTLVSDGSYNSGSLNSGTPWTWQQIVDDLWGIIQTSFPDAQEQPPQIPSWVTGTPQGFYFWKTNAWSALCRVAEAAALICRFDPTDQSVDFIPFDPSLATAPTPVIDLSTRLIWDTSNVASERIPWPESLCVTFPRPGRNDRYQVVVPLGLGGVSGTQLVVCDDMPAVGSAVANTVALSARASNVASAWQWSMINQYQNSSWEYTGIVDDIRVSQGFDFQSMWGVGDRHDSQQFGGLTTARMNAPVFRERCDPLFLEVGGSGSSGYGSGSGSGWANGSGSGGGSGGYQWITYLYQDQCNSGVLQQFRASLFGGLSLVPYATDYVYWKDIGCCSCGGSTSGSGSGSASGSSSGGSGTVTVSCCPANPVNLSLNLTVSGTGGGTFPIVNTGSGNWDTGLFSLTGAGAGTLTLRLYCFGTTWSFQNNTGSPNYTVTSISMVSASCSPLSLTFTGVLSGVGSYNGQTRTFTVSI